MRRSLVVASRHHDARATKEFLARCAAVTEPIPVYSTLAETAVPIGYCIRLWQEEAELWAELEISEGADWPSEDPHFHGECLVTYRDSLPDLLGVIVTSMPRGLLAPVMEGAFQTHRSGN